MDPAAVTAPPVLLVSTTRPSLPAIRALGSRGVSVWAATQEPGIASRSRYLRGFFATPHPLTSTAAFLERLLEVSGSFATPPVLLPCDDVSVGIAAAEAEALGSRYRLAVTDPERVRRLLDKAVQVELVARAGVRVPRTWTPAVPGDAGDIAREARFPLLVKPRTAQQFLVTHGVKALQVENPVELAAVLDRFPAMLVQEIVAGPVESLYEHNSFVDRGGAVRASSVARKRDEDPKPFGSATAIELVTAPDVEEAGLAVVRALGFRGGSHTEFKVDPAGGAPVFIEFNPRFAWSAAVQTAGRVDTIYLTYAEAAGLPLPALTPRRERTVWFTPERITKGRALRPPAPLADSLPGRARLVTDVLDGDDPTDLGPLMAELTQAARLRARRLARRLPHLLAPWTDSSRAPALVRAVSARLPRRAWRITGVTGAGGRATVLCLAPHPALATRLLARIFSGSPEMQPCGRRLLTSNGVPAAADLVVTWVPAPPSASFQRVGWVALPANPRRALEARHLDRLAGEVAIARPATSASHPWAVEVVRGDAGWEGFCRTMLRPSLPGGLREEPAATPYLRRAARGAELYRSLESGTPVAGVLALREGRLLRLLAGGVLHGSDRLRRAGASWAAVRHALGEGLRSGCTHVTDETTEHAQRHPELHVSHDALLVVRAASATGERLLDVFLATEEQGEGDVLTAAAR